MRHDVENNNFCNLFYIFKEFANIDPSMYKGGFKKNKLTI